MKKLIALAMLLASTSLASAADLPVMPLKSPYMAAPIFSWSGFYLGSSIGGGWAHDTDSDTLTVTHNGVAKTVGMDTISGSMGGFVTGIQGGYNYQLGAFVLGGEADIYTSSQSGTGSVALTTKPLVGATDSITNRINMFGTLRGRAGWLMTPSLLLYGTGGFAWQHVDFNEGVTLPNNGPTIGLATGQSTRAGWTVGGGAEWNFAGNWTARLQYLYIDTGTFAVNTALTPTVNLATTIHTINNVATVGVNFKF